MLFYHESSPFLIMIYWNLTSRTLTTHQMIILGRLDNKVIDCVIVFLSGEYSGMANMTLDLTVTHLVIGCKASMTLLLVSQKSVVACDVLMTWSLKFFGSGRR